MTGEQVTLLRPQAEESPARGASSAFPADLNRQIRGRIRLLALLFIIAFSVDIFFYGLSLLLVTFTSYEMPPDAFAGRAFQWANLGMVLISAGLWGAARSPKVSASRLHTLGLGYEIAVCFLVTILTYWPYYISYHILPNLSWAPAIIIMFPLIVPGAPSRMLIASLIAAVMTPLALFLLDAAGKVPVTGDNYFQATFSNLIGVGFAYLGARLIYGLGREVAKARAMGSYHLEERLGQGGMGEVWRARHRLLARPAAIKLIRPVLAASARPGVSDDAQRRFEREAQVIARLRSPHTVNLFDFGVADDGSFYYVMELLDGLDADALVRRYGPIPPERVVFLLQQVCHSLSEAESCGLVHRDIKPANIFLCRYGEDDDFVKVLDFGIAKAMATPETGPALTHENAIQGTPAFIAPEQALSEAGLDGRADIYALGCVAYWLLTGQLVFNAESPVALVMHHVGTAPAPPSTRIESAIPASLDRLVLDCLAKDPTDRPQSARDLSRRLAEIETVVEWTETRRREWWDGHRRDSDPAGAGM